MSTSDSRPQGGPRPVAGGRRTVTVTLGIPALVSSVILLCVCIVWAFILGIILGRGHAPERHIPELQRIMPQASPTPAAQVISGDGKSLARAEANATAGAEASGSARSAGEPARSGVLSQQDLDFRNALKGGQQPATPASTRPQTADKADKDKAARDKKAEQAKSADKKADKAARETPVDPKKQAYDYLYQVAAYKDAPSSDALAARLRQSGLKARTEKERDKESTWYKTVVSFRGTPEEIASLRRQLAAHNITRLILKAKTPVKP